MIQLQDGCYARLRNGRTVGPFRALDPGGVYAFSSIGQGWTLDGKFMATATEPHPLDVVEVCERARS
jgi:hypothetical protein